MDDIYLQEPSAASEVSEHSGVDKDAGAHKNGRTTRCREVERNPVKMSGVRLVAMPVDSGIFFNRSSCRSRKRGLGLR